MDALFTAVKESLRLALRLPEGVDPTKDQLDAWFRKMEGRVVMGHQLVRVPGVPEDRWTFQKLYP